MLINPAPPPLSPQNTSPQPTYPFEKDHAVGQELNFTTFLKGGTIAQLKFSQYYLNQCYRIF